MDTSEQYIKTPEHRRKLSVAMLDKAIESEPLAFENFDRTKNVQDQLQEMINLSPLPLVSLFSAYVNDVPVYGMEWSMEQLWLAFIMKMKYSKVWNGEDWNG